MYTVYILRSVKTGRYYCGSTQDMGNRLREHNAGENVSTRHGVPRECLHTEEFDDRKEAVTREKEIKSRGMARYLTDHQQNPG
ncbi:MAG: GIY-YIG nuclease family protein [Ignavibacteria bacterium]|nr:GIY-YIG nuclease family protein [Ignavibacteria bacterium]